MSTIESMKANPLRLTPQNTALLIVDVQVDFCSPDGLSAQRGRSLRAIQAILPKLNVFHQKMHKIGLLTIFTKFLYNPKKTPANFQLLTQKEGFSSLCLEDTQGTNLYQMNPYEDDFVFDKYTYDCFTGTNLKDLLVTRSIENILITGVRTDICVDTTARRAFAEGFNVFVIEDLVATKDDSSYMHVALLETFKKYFGFVEQSERILSRLTNDSIRD